MKTTHTPGPWKTVIGPSTCAVTTANEAPYQAGICRILEKSASYHEGEAEANARLIAAAPELLAALRVAALICAKQNSLSYADRREAHEIVMQAIAKAEGNA